MSLKLKSISGSGDLEQERVIIDVLEDGDIGRFMLIKTKKLGEKAFSGRFEENYWFPNKVVSKGDLIVLYSKTGQKNETKNDDDSTTHFFYWNQKEPLWIEADDAIGLIEISRWQFTERTKTET